MSFLVDGKTALVTGGGSGICLEFARLLLDHGCNVVIADLGLRPEAEEVILEKERKGKAIFVQTDVTNWGQLQKAFDTAMQDFGSLDIVCPGAGVYEPAWSSFWNFKDSVDTVETSSYKIMDINVNHPMRATQLAIDYFKRQKHGGSVVHISSIAAQSPNFSAPMYTASKAAVSAFVRCFDVLEPKLNIRVTAVAPGIVKTPLVANSALKDAVDEEIDTMVLPEQVAQVMLDLVQKEEYVGGTILEVGAEDVRKVERLNDPGPQDKKGFTLAKGINLYTATDSLIEAEFGK